MLARFAGAAIASTATVLVVFAPAANAAYDGETFGSEAACDAAARQDMRETADTTADMATCETVAGSGGREWVITITPRPWLNDNSDSGDPNDFAGGFMEGLASGSSGR